MNKKRERKRLKKYKEANKKFMTKKIYCVQYHAGMCGTDNAVLVAAENEDEAVDMCIDTAWDWYWQFNESHEDDDEEFAVEPEVDCWAEEYDEEKHRGIIFETEQEIERLRRECLE